MPFWENFVPPKLTSSICKKILFRRLRILSWISCSSILAKSCTVSGPSIIQKLHSKHNKWTDQHSWTTFKLINADNTTIYHFIFLITKEPSMTKPFRLSMVTQPQGVECACHNQHQITRAFDQQHHAPLPQILAFALTNQAPWLAIIYWWEINQQNV